MAKAKNKSLKPLNASETVHLAATALFSMKAEEVVLLDLQGLSTIADFYLICTCQNEAQMRGVLNHIQRALSRQGVKALRSEYMPGVRWAVLDYGDVIVHLFEKKSRVYYSLERLWGDAKSTLLKAADYAAPESLEVDKDEDDEL